PARNPHPFTGFDPKDSPRLDALKRTAANGDTVFQRPYHLLNAAINLTSGTNLAWQQRKAGNFMFSPQWCGYDLADSAGCFQPTPDFVKDLGWLSLGTPMGISGAAASPNMGFHSSPPVAVLMTVFNVRLGWWLQNPRFGSVWRSPGPAWGLLYLGQELLGMSNERAGYVSVSDGGHFENLGLYELVRRRCRVIFSVDAGQDRSFGFDDLANAIRRCYTDFGIRIDIDTRSVCPDDKGCSAFQCAVGSIHYEDVDPGAAPGTLFYMKPCITGDEPADVLNYRATHPEFPHESTGDQWFDEAQFESYRKLGHHMTSKLLYDVVKDDMTTADFSRLLWETWGPAGRNR
ncbi:MAG: hypothetical protein KIT73_20770, partial [Burkholderiales bacterium]|nr:hypothetical protein [Burkholderiales bacterium]